MKARLTLDCSQKFIADLLDRNGWTLTLRSVPGRRFRAVVANAQGTEVASKVGDDFAAALIDAVSLAIETTPQLHESA